MEIFIPARSPLFALTPCRDCAADGVGWRVGNGSTSDGTGGGGGRLSIAFNFTGTGLEYRFARPIPDSWISRLLVNASTPGTPATLGKTAVTNLPLSQHRFTLDLFPPPADPFSLSNISTTNRTEVMFLGATGYLGSMVTVSTRNITIDDSAWRTGQVLLSPAWNMLEGANGGESNWINGTQMDQERVTAKEHYNESLSWTEVRGANTTVRFEGEAVWAYGLAGGEAGRYEIVLDNTTMGVFNASGGARAYNQILFHISALASGNHTLTLRNVDGGKRLSFDRLIATSGMSATAPRTPIPTPSALPPSLASDSAGSNRLSGGSVAGIIVAAVFGSALVLAAIILMRKRRQRKADTDEYTSEKPGDTDKTFFSWPRQRRRPFFQLPDAASGGVAGGAAAMLSRVLPGRKSGTWSYPSARTKTSFVPGLDSPRASPTMPEAEKRYTSFTKFSMSPRRERRMRPNISSPIPMSETGLGRKADDVDDEGTAMAAALAGRTISPLAQLRNPDFADPRSNNDESYLPKMPTFGAMLAASPKIKPGEAGGTAWDRRKRTSMDTIGKIFGQYGGARESAGPLHPPFARQQPTVGLALGSPADAHGWVGRR